MTYVSVIKYGRTTEILWFRTYVPGLIPGAIIKGFFINLVIMYWTLNSIYVQFEYQYSKSCNSVEHVQLLRGILKSFVARGVYCLKLV